MAAAKSLTREQLSLRGSIAAHARWSGEDPARNARRGQRGLREKFDREVREAEPGLSEDEYARRSEHAYLAHMGRVALASSKARGARKAAPRTRRKAAPEVREAAPAPVNAIVRDDPAFPRNAAERDRVTRRAARKAGNGTA
jgi:hypothetical protein